jgi:hypothetical protein
MRKKFTMQEIREMAAKAGMTADEYVKAEVAKAAQREKLKVERRAKRELKQRA